MHTEWDTATRDHTLALYGVKRHPVADMVRASAQFIAYTVLIFAPVLGIHALAYTLFPA